MALPEDKRREGILTIAAWWTSAISSAIGMWVESMLAGDTKSLAVTSTAVATVMDEARAFFGTGARLALAKHPEMKEECGKVVAGFRELTHNAMAGTVGKVEKAAADTERTEEPSVENVNSRGSLSKN